MIMLDNASNNNTMMETMEKLLHQHGIKFDRDGNQIRFVSLSLVFLIICLVLKYLKMLSSY